MPQHKQTGRITTSRPVLVYEIGKLWHTNPSTKPALELDTGLQRPLWKFCTARQDAQSQHETGHEPVQEERQDPQFLPVIEVSLPNSLRHGKYWTEDDLHDERFMQFGFLLLYKAHGRRALHFGKSIHIHYTEFPRMLAERMNHRRGASDEDKQLAGREAV
jgi:hypothetical protein